MILGQRFLEQGKKKVSNIRRKNDMLDFVKIKNFSLSKINIKKVKKKKLQAGRKCLEHT